MSESRKYKNPPAIEVLCEIHFSETESNLTLFGDFYQQIKDKYPEQKQLNQVGFEMDFSQEAIQARQLNSGAMMRFSSSDSSRLVQITQSLLTVNKLKPYLGYESFKEDVAENLQVYLNLSKPKYFERVGMRYIDRILIPEDDFGLEKYFNFSLDFANSEFSTINGISFRVQLTPKHSDHILLVTLNSVISKEEGNSEFILDMYDTFALQKEIDKNHLLTILDEAHENTELVFEAVITDAARNLFDEEKK